MADPRQRVPLQSSLSFSGPSMSDSASRNLKRRLTATASDDEQFIPSEATFNPAPYHPPHTQHLQRVQQPRISNPPLSSAPPPSRGAHTARHHHGANPAHLSEPSPNDPDAVFIHPPFTDFPNAHLYKDGLTYNLMAANPEWFLDPADFISAENTNPEAIAYPSQLEPPRGWCPQKRKDMKDGWPEGEEPRLRCTFCRRYYAGVNAKSMWRRHVYEKHKIAMSNRRDNMMGRGGRASNKENRGGRESARASGSRPGCRTSDDIDHTPSTSQGSRSEAAERGRLKASTSSSYLQDSSDDEVGPPGLFFQSQSDAIEPDVFGAIKSSSTPPLTPGGPSPSRSTHDNSFGPESPYDPLVTPAFRHSPARPARQPWRYPSPSHPLYSRGQELSLSMLTRGEASPMISGLDVSPLGRVPAGERKKHSILNSPFVSREQDRISIFDQSPARLLFDGPPSSAKSNRSPFTEYRIPESPLCRPSTNSLRISSLTEATKKWQAEAASGSPRKTTAAEGSGLLGPIELQTQTQSDVFSDINSWVEFNAAADGSTSSPARALTVAESPVVRTAQQTSLSAVTKGSSGFLNFGSGLMDAFLSGKGTKNIESSDSDSDSDMSGPNPGSPIRAGKKTRRAFSSGWSKDDDGDTEMHDLQPKKRRRTINGRE